MKGASLSSLLSLIGINTMKQARWIRETNKGVTLLVAIITINILLAIGLSLSNLSYKSLKVSSSGRETQRAYYAAEAGFECAQYWDKSGEFTSEGSQASISCNGQDLTINSSSFTSVEYGSGRQYEFTIDFMGGEYCAHLIVMKPTAGIYQTIIETRGYNTCDMDSQGIVERGIRIKKS